MEQKIILVTGGNRGIGKEICRQMVQLGWKVLLGARSIKKGKIAADEMNGGIVVIELDSSDENSIQKAAGKIDSDFGYIDVVVNNAGIGVGSNGLIDPEIGEVREIFDTNFFGPMMVNKYFIPLLRKSENGRIINMSSGMGAWDDLVNGYAGYRLSKTGLNAQTVLLANELKSEGIKVNAMCPGWVRTDMGGSGAHRSVEKGAETAVWLASELEIPTGKFFRDKKEIAW